MSAAPCCGIDASTPRARALPLCCTVTTTRSPIPSNEAPAVRWWTARVAPSICRTPCCAIAFPHAQAVQRCTAIRVRHLSAAGWYIAVSCDMGMISPLTDARCCSVLYCSQLRSRGFITLAVTHLHRSALSRHRVGLIPHRDMNCSMPPHRIVTHFTWYRHPQCICVCTRIYVSQHTNCSHCLRCLGHALPEAPSH